MENKYAIILKWSEIDNCYVTKVPDLPGCMSDGSTPDEAVENTRQIIREWIDYAEIHGIDVPEPKTMVADVA